MKQQILVIHGGDAFATYEEYIEFLKEFEIDPYMNRMGGWRSNLEQALGDKYEVFLPQMPNYFNVKHIEWKIWFEKYFPFLRDGVILIGHSFGGTFLAKYLSEHTLPFKVKGTFFVSSPYSRDGEREVVEHVLPESLSGLIDQGGKIFLYHSKDDSVVPFSEIEKYKLQLPQAKITIFEDRDHFSQEEFPEIITDIKSLE